MLCQNLPHTCLDAASPLRHAATHTQCARAPRHVYYAFEHNQHVCYAFGHNQHVYSAFGTPGGTRPASQWRRRCSQPSRWRRDTGGEMQRRRLLPGCILGVGNVSRGITTWRYYVALGAGALSGEIVHIERGAGDENFLARSVVAGSNI